MQIPKLFQRKYINLNLCALLSYQPPKSHMFINLFTWSSNYNVLTHKIISDSFFCVVKSENFMISSPQK